MSNCVICGENSTKQLYTRNGYTRVRCASDGHTFVSNPPSIGELVDLYSKDYYTGRGDVGYYHDVFANKQRHTDKANRKLQRIQGYVEGGKILDVGCGPGFLVKAASDHYNVTGVDISQAAADYANQEFGLEIWVGDFMDFPDDGLYDAVSMFSFIEHTLDPRRNLEKANSILQSGGILLLSIPNINGIVRYIMGKKWRGFSAPDHLHFFSTDNLRRLIRETGFAPLDTRLSENHVFRDTIYLYARKE